MIRNRGVILSGLLLLLILRGSSLARVPYPVDPTYEDTVRIVLLEAIGANGDCYNPPVSPPVGVQTYDFVKASLDPAYVHQIKTLDRGTATLAQVQALWPGKMPHVIVNINSGWGIATDNLQAILNWAVQNYIGVVEVGDDASGAATNTFGIQGVDNMPEPMGDGRWLSAPDDTLWIKSHPSRDTAMDSAAYPFLTGVVHNAALKVMHDSTFHFKPTWSPFGPDSQRCQADADAYQILTGYENKLTFLGYQQGWNAASDGGARTAGSIGAADQWSVIVVIQDSIKYGTGSVVRRGVMLSFQPQFLRNTVAAQQLTYDAIMYASLTHLLKPVGIKIDVSANSITAGQKATLTATIVADLLDSTTRQRLAQYTTWSLDTRYRQPGDSLLSTMGRTVQVTATKAFRYLYVVGSVYDSAFAQWRIDTAKIYVNPAADYQVIIEKTSKTPIAQQADIMPKTYADSTTARPIDMISLDSAQKTAYAYAVVRDRYGNIKRAATNGLWEEVTPPGAVGAAPTPGKLWEGVITRTGSGHDSIRAWEAGLTPDTVAVVANAGILTALRIVDTLGNVVTLVNINTDQWKFLRVQGQWSDKPGDQWFDFPAYWSMTPDTLRSSISLPTAGTEAVSWTFSPLNPGEADLTVRNAANTQHVTVHVKVTVAPPSRVEIELVDKDPIAGVPFRAVVRIYNTDGPVPGRWCFPGEGPSPAVYQDILMRMGQYPLVTTGAGADTVNLRPAQSQTVPQCFVNGIDTARFTLFSPAGSDSLHQLFVKLQGVVPLEASTEKFSLRPGPVARIVIGDALTCSPLPHDTTLHAPSGLLIAATCGYDAYGNPLGQVPSVWTSNGTLHAPPTAPRAALYYTSATVNGPEDGCIIAAAQANPGAVDTICVRIIPQAAVATAITRDMNGDGYLDTIELRFDRPVDLTGATVTVGYSHYTDVVDFPVTGVHSVSGNATDTVFYVTLTEVPTPSSPQTAWTAPYLTVKINNAPNVSDSVRYIDGAGPVVWLASETVNDSDPHRKLNLVTVTFSEKVIKQGGGALTASDIPKLILDVWKTQTGTLRDSLVLDSITSLKSVSTDRNGRTVVEFLTVNVDFSNQWVNIRVVPVNPDSTYHGVVDNVQNQWNPPVLDNRRVQVVVYIKYFKAVAGPNPFPPSTALNEAGPTLVYHTKDELVDRALNGTGGTIIHVTVGPTTPGQNPAHVSAVKSLLKVYDIAGNLVYHRGDDNYRPATEVVKSDSVWASGTRGDLWFYWSGVNDRGILSAPGMYRAMVYVKLKVRDTVTSQEVEQAFPPYTVALGVRK